MPFTIRENNALVFIKKYLVGAYRGIYDNAMRGGDIDNGNR